jgi:hypothetical protein
MDYGWQLLTDDVAKFIRELPQVPTGHANEGSSSFGAAPA